MIFQKNPQNLNNTFLLIQSLKWTMIYGELSFVVDYTVVGLTISILQLFEFFITQIWYEFDLQKTESFTRQNS